MGFDKKIFRIIIIIVVLLLVVGAFFIYNTLIKTKLVKAQLHVESGEVKVDDVLVSGNVKLKKQSIVETLDGLATVILYESILISLFPNTIVKVEDLILSHPTLKQEKGKTWNMFTKLFGVEDYTISTGNSIASVRATGFLLSEDKVITGIGLIDYITEGKSFIVPARRVVEKVDGEIIERDATKEELREIKGYIKRSINELKYLRKLEIDKHKFLGGIIKKQYSLTDEQIEKGLEAADSGLIDVDELYKKHKTKIPFKIGPITKIINITKSIQELNKLVNEINEEENKI